MPKQVDISKIGVQVVRNAINVVVELFDSSTEQYHFVTAYPIVDEDTGVVAFMYYDSEGYATPVYPDTPVRNITVSSNHSHVEQLTLFTNVFHTNELVIFTTTDNRASIAYTTSIRSITDGNLLDGSEILLSIYREFVKKLLNIYPVLMPINGDIQYKAMSSANEVYCIVTELRHHKDIQRPKDYVLAVTPVFHTNKPKSLVSNPDYDASYKQSMINHCRLLADDKSYSPSSMELIYI